MTNLKPRTSTRSSMIPNSPISSIGLRPVLLPQSRTRIDAAHAGPSLPSEPSRVPTLLNPENSIPFLNSSLLTVMSRLLPVKLQDQVKVATVATCRMPSATFKLQFPNSEMKSIIPCSIATTHILQELVTTLPTASTRLPRLLRSKYSLLNRLIYPIRKI